MGIWRKLRHHKIARIAVAGAFVALFLATMFLLVYFFVYFLGPLIEYSAGQSVNPFRFAFDLGIGLLFFLLIWKMPTVRQSITWGFLLLVIYSGGFIADLVTFAAFHQGLTAFDAVIALMYGLVIVFCAVALLKPVGTELATKIVYVMSILSWVTTVVSYVFFYGLIVGIARALASGVVGPFVVVLATALRLQGDWESREQMSDSYDLKRLDTVSWARKDATIIEAKVDSFDKASREVKIHICRFEGGGKCEDKTLRISDSVGNLVWKEIDNFSGEDAHLLVKDGEIVNISFWGIPMKEDPLLLKVVEELSSELNIDDVGTDQLFWKRNRVPVSIWPYFQPPYRLLLDESLATEIDLRDWKPLIASTLIFNRRLWRRKVFRELPLLLWLLVSPSLAIALLDTFRSRVFSPEIDAYLLVVAGISSLGAFVTFRFQKAMHLKADTLAAKITGKDSFLEVLRKVETGNRASSRSRVGEWAVRLFTAQPSPKERIAWLKKSK